MRIRGSVSKQAGLCSSALEKISHLRINTSNRLNPGLTWELVLRQHAGHIADSAGLIGILTSLGLGPGPGLDWTGIIAPLNSPSNQSHPGPLRNPRPSEPAYLIPKPSEFCPVQTRFIHFGVFGPCGWSAQPLNGTRLSTPARQKPRPSTETS